MAANGVAARCGRAIARFSSPDVLLRMLLLHVARGYSLRETVVRAKLANWTDIFKGSEFFFGPFAEILYSIEPGFLARAKLFGMEAFEYLKTDPKTARLFDAAMTGMSALVGPVVAGHTISANGKASWTWEAETAFCWRQF
jgi:hypothetical protein